MNYDDETLMAYADGELDETQRAEITAAMERDPELARRVAKHRALRAEVAAAFSSVLTRPMPDRLVRAAQGQSGNDQSSNDQAGKDDRTPATRRGTVVQFPGRASRAPATTWRAREWTAMAASLILGALISWKMFAPDPALITPKGGELVASGALATALERQLGSKQLGNEPVLIGLTFRTEGGQYCRSYSLARAATAGLACRVGSDWRIVTTAAASNEGGDVRQAASPPPAVMHAIESRISGDALDAAGEEIARDAGWDAGFGRR